MSCLFDMVRVKKVLSYLIFWRWPKKILALLFVVLLIGGGYYFYQQRNKPKEPIQTTAVKRQEIKSVISSSGSVNGKDSVDLRFKTSGRLVYLNAKVGDSVEKGRYIAGLDTQDLSIALQQARNDFLAKDATAKKVEDDVKNHDKDENYTQRETRIKAQAARDSAFDAVKEAQRAFQDASIYSPLEGIVTKADQNVGQVVTASDVIAQIVDIDEIYFDAEVDESDIGKVQLGQSAEVILNSYEDQVFSGKVTEIKPTTNETSTGATVVIVKINLGNPAINFVTGLNGQSEITLKKVFEALTIPLEALNEDSSVIVKEGDKFVKKKITTGISSDTDIEVTEGLEENQLVVTNPSAVKL